MGATLQGPAIPPRQALAAHPLLLEFEQLAGDLGDFPVGPLLDLYMGAAQPDRPNAYRLLDSCLGTWIAGLEGALFSDVWHDSEIAASIQERRRETRDALALMKSALSQAESGVGSRSVS